jgi:DNA-binding transcriptional regulator YiaG
VVIENIDELHLKIAVALILKRDRLAAPEIKYLRKFLGWSGEEHARRHGVPVATVRAWEAGEVAMPVSNEKELRFWATTESPQHEYEPGTTITIAHTEHGWLAA